MGVGASIRSSDAAPPGAGRPVARPTRATHVPGWGPAGDRDQREPDHLRTGARGPLSEPSPASSARWTDRRCCVPTTRAPASSPRSRPARHIRRRRGGRLRVVAGARARGVRFECTTATSASRSWCPSPRWCTRTNAAAAWPSPTSRGLARRRCPALSDSPAWPAASSIGRGGGVDRGRRLRHLPTEVRAAWRRRPDRGSGVAVFQPHRYSRTARWPGFADAFVDADRWPSPTCTPRGSQPARRVRQAHVEAVLDPSVGGRGRLRGLDDVLLWLRGCCDRGSVLTLWQVTTSLAPRSWPCSGQAVTRSAGAAPLPAAGAGRRLVSTERHAEVEG